MATLYSAIPDRSMRGPVLGENIRRIVSYRWIFNVLLTHSFSISITLLIEFKVCENVLVHRTSSFFIAGGFYGIIGGVEIHLLLKFFQRLLKFLLFKKVALVYHGHSSFTSMIFPSIPLFAIMSGILVSIGSHVSHR